MEQNDIKICYSKQLNVSLTLWLKLLLLFVPKFEAIPIVIQIKQHTG